MQPFFLEIKPKAQQPAINYQSKLCLVGSCFVENIGEKLNYYKFRTNVNPFGIIFHPEAILNILERIVYQNEFTENDIFFNNGQWQSFEVHSKLNKIEKNDFLNSLNSALKSSYDQLKEASHIVLTFGTAWGYWHKKQNKIVANCHKVPQSSFNKKLSSVNELYTNFNRCFELIKQINLKVTIITTISPVRHIKDGIVENNLSKANLIAALHQGIASKQNVHYYPAYEITMDCLRDYRFYNADLIHPNQMAIDFIWEHFTQTWLYETETLSTLKKVGQIQKGLQHKPFNPESDAHLKFAAALENKIDEVLRAFPFISF